jgi:hypothetical protein
MTAREEQLLAGLKAISNGFGGDLWIKESPITLSHEELVGLVIDATHGLIITEGRDQVADEIVVAQQARLAKDDGGSWPPDFYAGLDEAFAMSHAIARNPYLTINADNEVILVAAPVTLCRRALATDLHDWSPNSDTCTRCGVARSGLLGGVR